MLKTIKEIILIALLLVAGLLIAKIIPFPSSLSSMILFLILLLSGVIKEEIFQGGISELILKNLSFFFLPPAVRILDSLEVLQGDIAKLIIIVLISNFLVMGVTGMVVQRLLKTEGNHRETQHA